MRLPPLQSEFPEHRHYYSHHAVRNRRELQWKPCYNLPLQLKARLEAVHFLFHLVTIPINRLVFKANVIKGADQGDFGKTEDIRSRHDEGGVLGGKLQKTIWNASGIFSGFSKYSILMRYQYMAYFSPMLFLGV